MAGLMNSYLYGKAGKADFTPEQLPKNRVALFFEMLRIRLGGIVGMNFLYILFELPVIVWTLATVMVLNAGLTVDEAGNIIDTATLTSVSGTLTLYFMILIPCLMVAYAFRPGIAYILRNWARDQHTFTMSDFKDAVKGNWKNGLLLGLVNGLSLLMTYVAYVYYGSVAGNSALWMVPQVMVLIFCAIWWMANMVITPMMVTYDMNFRTLARNGVIMTLARLPWALLIWIPSIVIPVLLLLGVVPYGMLIFVALYLLVGFGLTQFIYASYANACFDRFLNPRIEGAAVNMGLRDPMLEEEDEEVTDEDIKNL